MLTLTKPAGLPRGLICPDSSGLEAKLADFIAAGPSGLHLVFDFDRTLTVRHPDTDDDITSWHILRQHLPAEYERQCRALYHKYRPLEVSGRLTQQGAREWSTSLLDAVVRSRLDLREVEQDFLSKACIRPGTAELFELCQQYGIPTVILSAGVKDVIDIWCRAYGIHPTLTLSSELELDQSGTVIGWRRDSLVHVMNKAEAGHPELTAIRAARPKAIVVGDSMHDADMAQGTDDVLRIRLYDRQLRDAFRIRHVRRQTFSKFDVLIESGSLQPVSELVRMVTCSAGPKFLNQ